MSARVDISAPSQSRLRISLQQHGLSIVGGATYHVTLYAKSTAPRQILVRIVGPSGQTLGDGSQEFQIGTSWGLYYLDMSSFLSTDNAYIAIDMGGTGETVWLDDVSVARIPPGTP
jgi:hypothetical protein